MIDPYGLTPEQKAALEDADFLSKAHNISGTITITSPMDDVKEWFRPTPLLVNRHQRRKDARKCR